MEKGKGRKAEERGYALDSDRIYYEPVTSRRHRRRMQSAEGHRYGPGTGRRRPKTPVLGEAPLSEVLAHIGSDEDNDNRIKSTGEGLFLDQEKKKELSDHSSTAYDSGKVGVDHESVRSSVKSFQWSESHARPASRSSSRGGCDDTGNNAELPATSLGVDDSVMKEVVHENSQKLFTKPRVLSASGGVRKVNVTPSPTKAERDVNNHDVKNEEDTKMVGEKVSSYSSDTKQRDDDDDKKGQEDSGNQSPNAKKMPSPGHYVSAQEERKVEDLIKIAEEFDKLPENKVLSSHPNIPKTPGWGNDDELLVEDV